jgi:uncharacterized protein with von Willebrand factor type A (vWA) domain
MTGTGRYLYGRWHEGPDPLAPPVDLSEAVDALGQDVMQGYSPRSALEELLRRGRSAREEARHVAEEAEARA